MQFTREDPTPNEMQASRDQDSTFSSLAKSIHCSHHFLSAIPQSTPLAHLGECQQVDAPLKGVQNCLELIGALSIIPVIFGTTFAGMFILCNL